MVGVDGVDIEFGFQVFDLVGGQVGIGEYVMLVIDEVEVVFGVVGCQLFDYCQVYVVDVVVYFVQFLFLEGLQFWVVEYGGDDVGVVGWWV